MPNRGHAHSRTERFSPASAGLAAAARHAAVAPTMLRESLLTRADRPAYGVSLALAGVLASSWARRGFGYLPLFGLDVEATRRMLDTHFPGASLHLPCAWDDLVPPRAFDEAPDLSELVDMLVEHRTVEDEDGTLLAHAIATATLGEEHLWEDMHLPSRQVLSDLFYGFFNGLAVRNRLDMRWKPFLQQQLRDRMMLRASKRVGA